MGLGKSVRLSFNRQHLSVLGTIYKKQSTGALPEGTQVSVPGFSIRTGTSNFSFAETDRLVAGDWMS